MPELAAQSQLCQHLPSRGPSKAMADHNCVSALPQPWAFQGHDQSQLRVSTSPAVGLPRRWPITTVSAPPQPWAFQGNGRSQLRVSTSPAVGLPRQWPITTACQHLPSRGPSKAMADHNCVSALPQPWAFQGHDRSQLRVSTSLAMGLPSWWPVSLLQRLPSFLGASL